MSGYFRSSEYGAGRTGALAHWRTGALAHWHTGTLAHWHTGTLAEVWYERTLHHNQALAHCEQRKVALCHSCVFSALWQSPLYSIAE
ncbi:hypothetical protein [Pantoea sp. AS142]|uniref:hypothetical protein n=1 Tax=Pantoea sp. AS142 TaxID=3081292 RepID=UPI0030196E3B